MTARPIASGRDQQAQDGYALGALLVSLAVMGIVASMALPVWSQVAKREREAELMFRGEQYARAVELYQRTYAATYPPDVETLIDERFLRRRYLDPMSEDGEFRVVYEAEAADLLASQPTAAVPGQPVARSGSNTDRDDPDEEAAADDDNEAAGLQLSDEPPAEGSRGGVVGVVSRSEEESLRIYKGGEKYNEWIFVYGGSASQPAGIPGTSPANLSATPGQFGASPIAPPGPR